MLDIKEMKFLCSAMNDICSILEIALGFTGKKKLNDAFERDMFSFLQAIAASDGEIGEDEKEYIDEFVKNSRYGAKLYSEKYNWNAETPVSLQLIVEAENKMMAAGQIERTVTDLDSCSPTSNCFKVFSQVGAGLIACDRNAAAEEVSYFTKLITSYQRYIFRNLKKTDFGNAFNVALLISNGSNRPKIVYLSKVTDELAPIIIDLPKDNTIPESQSNSDTLDELMQKLNDLVGLDSVKEEVTSLINLIKIQEVRKSRGMKLIPISYHMVFTGNPGTGKTTVARLLAEIYRELGVLSKGNLVETDRSGLVAGYVGQTALKVQEKVREAMGGILFIDEAYALTFSDSPNDFGREAIDTLVKAMEDNRDDLIVIAAGYTEPMRKFIDSNPGLRSRFNKYLYFPDYEPDELTEIFRRMCTSNGYEISPEAETAIKEKFSQMYENRNESFGNGRDVRNIFEKAVTKQATRLAGVRSPSNTQIITLEKSDME